MIINCKTCLGCSVSIDEKYTEGRKNEATTQQTMAMSKIQTKSITHQAVL